MSIELPEGPVDWSVVGDICGQRTDRILNLLRLFLEDSAAELAKLEHAWAAGDLHALSEVAHRLRGSAQIMGVSSLVSLAGDLEHSGKRGTIDDVRTLVARLASELDAVAQFIAPLLPVPR